MPFDAFISYSHTDKLIADSACAIVEAAGIRCWIAPRDIRPGAEWSESISEGIEQCRVMVLIFTSSSNVSRQVRREVAHAFNKGLTIVPVRIERIEPDRALAFHIETFHWLDALTEPRERYFRELASHIKAILETRPEPLRERSLNPALDAPFAGRETLRFEWVARAGTGFFAGFVLLLLIVLLLYPLMGEETGDKFIYLWGGYVGGFSGYTILFLLKWGGFWGLCFAILEKHLARKGSGYWWYVALSGAAVGSMTFVWDVFEFSSAFTGVYFADPANSLTLPVFLWTALGLLLWAFGLAAFLRRWIPRLLRWRVAASGRPTAA